MEFTLGYIKSEKQMFLKTFDNSGQSQSSKVVDAQDFKNQPVQALILDNDVNTQELEESLVEASRFYPIRSSKDLHLSGESFENLEDNAAVETYRKIHKSWVLQNNLRLLNDLVPTVMRLKELWPNNRSDFFEELWFLLKTNLGSKSLTLLYNDLKKGKNENEKDKLIRVRIDGETIPNPVEGGEAEEAIFKNYEAEFGLPLHFCDLDMNKGELVATMMIKQSPVIIMARQSDLTMLQKSMLKALAEALDTFI